MLCSRPLVVMNMVMSLSVDEDLWTRYHCILSSKSRRFLLLPMGVALAIRPLDVPAMPAGTILNRALRGGSIEEAACPHRGPSHAATRLAATRDHLAYEVTSLKALDIALCFD